MQLRLNCTSAAAPQQAQRRFTAFAPVRQTSPGNRAKLAAAHATGKGFEAGSKTGKKRQPKLARYLAEDDGGSNSSRSGSAAAAISPGEGWSVVQDCDPASAFLSKPVQPHIFPTGQAICLYKVGDEIFASDAYSTAFKYPLADASILSMKGRPAVESPLDGTVYSLCDGSVLSW